VAFLLPFAGIGLFAAVQAVRFAATGDSAQAGFFALFALVFGGVGIGGILGVLAGRRALVDRAALEARHPDAPWLWRADWAAGRIEDSTRGAMWAAWMFAGFWNLVSFPAAWFGTRAALSEGNTAALLALLFPVVGAGLLVWAVRVTLRYRRYGVSVLELGAVPGVVGHSIGGVVRTTSLLRPPEGFQVRLTSIRRVVRGSGKHRSTSERVLWEEERRVPATSTAIPFAFATPRPPTAPILAMWSSGGCRWSPACPAWTTSPPSRCPCSVRRRVIGRRSAASRSGAPRRRPRPTSASLPIRAFESPPPGAAPRSSFRRPAIPPRQPPPPDFSPSGPARSAS
jgi:hypothetical protein